MKIFEEFHHFSHIHKLIVFLVILKSLMSPRHYRPCCVSILIKQVFKYLEMLLYEETNRILILLLLEAQVKQLELFQLFQYKTAF